MCECALIQGASRGLGTTLVRVLLAADRRRRVFATCRTPQTGGVLAQLASLEPRLEILQLDVTREESIAAAADLVRERVGSLDLLVNVAGVLHGDRGLAPEKRLEAVSPDLLRRVFEVNAFGPLLVAKHFHPFLEHDRRAVLANVSARVGSIGDNRAGGWYAYRGSKAAQNMFTRTIAIELRRRAPNAIVVATSIPARWTRTSPVPSSDPCRRQSSSTASAPPDSSSPSSTPSPRISREAS